MQHLECRSQNYSIRGKKKKKKKFSNGWVAIFYWQHWKFWAFADLQSAEWNQQSCPRLLSPLITITESHTAAATELMLLISPILKVSEREIGESQVKALCWWCCTLPTRDQCTCVSDVFTSHLLTPVQSDTTASGFLSTLELDDGCGSCLSGPNSTSSGLAKTIESFSIFNTNK